MHLKTILLAAVAWTVAATADRNARDVEPCAQITKIVADAKQGNGASLTCSLRGIDR